MNYNRAVELMLKGKDVHHPGAPGKVFFTLKDEAIVMAPPYGGYQGAVISPEMMESDEWEEWLGDRPARPGGSAPVPGETKPVAIMESPRTEVLEEAVDAMAASEPVIVDSDWIDEE